MGGATPVTQEIGGIEWKVGQHVLWLMPDGKKVIREIVGFITNSRTGELQAVMDNRFAFGGVDVEQRYVEECRKLQCKQ
jgi:hypothetical protein